jgi:hypothetical protein
VPEGFVPGFQVVDDDLDWRNVDTVEELSDAPLLERELIREYLDT